MSTIDAHRFVFLCGLHKSGTSPLFRILREHPQISGFSNTGVSEDEGQHLQSVFPTGEAFGGPGVFGFAQKAHLTEKSRLATAPNGTKLFAEWAKYWDLTCPYLLEKSPPNLIKTRFLQALFPDSYFIVISRHPIAVSMATRKWTDASLRSLVEHWLHCHDLFERDSTKLRRILRIRYEDLIDSPLTVLEEVRNFLGLASQLSGTLDPKGNQQYFAAWRALAIDKKGQDMQRRVIRKYEKKVRRYGYSLVKCEQLLPVNVPHPRS